MKFSFAKIYYPLACCLFMTCLLLPLVEEKFNLIPDVNNEKRTFAKMPSLKSDSLTFFPKAFEGFYNDHFGFRQTLVKLNSLVRYYLFHSSPTPDKVGLGKQDWLYLTGPSYNITQDLSRSNLYKGDELKEAVKIWEGRKRELRERNIRYYKAFWPDKNYIYPECMPLGMMLTDRGGPHKCDQAIAYLKEQHSEVQIIDVRSDLLEAKKQQQLYFKDDSHWNNYGAFIAYTHLIKVMSKDISELKPYDTSDFVIAWKQRNRTGDLCDIINMNWRESHPVFTSKHAFEMKKLPALDYPEKTKIYWNAFAQTPLKALIYRDSYTEALEPFLMLHFREIVFIWDSEYSTGMVERVKPDVVIECLVSRDFR